MEETTELYRSLSYSSNFYLTYQIFNFEISFAFSDLPWQPRAESQSKLRCSTSWPPIA